MTFRIGIISDTHGLLGPEAERRLIGVHARAPRRIVCRAELRRRKSDGESACPRIIRVYDTLCAVFKTGDCVP